MRASAANTALVIIGCLLVITAPVWRLGIAPALKVVATDFDYIYFYDGSLDVYTGGALSAIPAALEQRVLSRNDLSTPAVSAVREGLRLYDKRNSAEVEKQTHYLAMNRKTGELQKARGCERATGNYIVFPFNSPKSDVPVWVERAKVAVKAKFAKKDKVGGVSVYRYDLEYHNLPCPPPPGFAETVKTSDVVSLMPPGFTMPPGDSLEASYVTAGKASYFVEPAMGSIVDVRGLEQSVSIKLSGSGFAATSLVFSFKCSLDKNSVTTATLFAKDEIAKLRLQFVSIPLGLLVFGVVVFLVGFFAGTKKKG